MVAAGRDGFTRRGVALAKSRCAISGTLLARLPGDARARPEPVEERLTTTFRAAHAGDVRPDPHARIIFGPLLRARGPGHLMPFEERALSLVARLTGISLIVLLVATGNCASVMLLRAIRRRREIEIRFALGLTRGRLATELISEFLLVAVAAAAAAALIGSWASQVLQAMLIPSARGATVSMDYRGLAAAAGFAFRRRCRCRCWACAVHVPRCSQ